MTEYDYHVEPTDDVALEATTRKGRIIERHLREGIGMLQESLIECRAHALQLIAERADLREQLAQLTEDNERLRGRLEDAHAAIWNLRVL